MLEDNDDAASNPQKLAIYRKGKEILEITEKITDLISEDNPMLTNYKRFMMEDASTLTIQVVSAEIADLYDLRMENATMIRKAARDLMAHCSGLETFGFKDIQYLALIRESLEEYRLLFVQWVKNFDKDNFIIDPWGLFNPPGYTNDEFDNTEE